MHVFYTPDISSSDYVLNEEESRHCTKVLRLGTGAKVHLIDGRGGLYTAEITSETRKNVSLKVITVIRDYGQRRHHLHLAVAPTKNIDRFEWFLEKATEAGIEEITPLICDRSERKTIKEDRLNKIITSAVKQSLQAYHPILHPPADLNEFIRQERSGTKMIAHCLENEPKQYISQVASPGQHYIILIGPEGDFTPQEIAGALRNGYKPLTLGNTRLRTETAALSACFEINYLNR